MFHFFVRVLFLSGFVFGALFALLLSLLQQRHTKSTVINNYVNYSFVDLYEVWFNKNHLKRSNVSFDLLRYSSNKYLTESRFLYKKIRVLCVILVRKLKNSDAAKKTWAKQCNGIMTVKLELERKNKIPVRKTKDNASWALLCKALRDLPASFNWILVINDNMFAIVENLRYMMAGLDHSRPYYLGHPMTFWGTNYNSGQAGYVLSNATLNAFKKKFTSPGLCTAESIFWNLEDYYLGKTLAGLDVFPSDTRDHEGLATFHGFNLQKLFFPGSTLLSNYYKFSLYPTKCCSRYSITFQVTEGDKMFTYNYLLYGLQLFRGGRYGNRKPSTPPPDEVWHSFLKERGITNFNITADKYYKLWEDAISDPESFAQKIKQETDAVDK